MGWFTDTLAKRLFLLMWAALVGSHLLAYAAVHLVQFGPHAPGRLPTLPSLPPTPGLGERPLHERLQPPPRRAPVPQGSQAEDAALGEDAAALPLPPPRDPGGEAPHHGPRPGPRLPTGVLLLDYGVRLLVIALAAWWGSRWLARPMRELVQASEQLSGALEGPARPQALDEQRGTREVREAARVFNGMALRLRRQFSERGLMVAAISHDLRTPLTRLRMRLETLDAPAEQRERAAADIREMNALIDQTLSLFRGAGDEAPQDTDVAALIQALADDLAEQGQPVQADLGAAPEAAAVARVQPQALRRVLDNLLGNALRYGAAPIRLGLAREPGALLLRVDDAGPGIPADQLEAVFQPFFRLEASRNRETGGSGLGLYIARDLVQRMGGSLRLLNRPEGGLRAEVRLPAAGSGA